MGGGQEAGRRGRREWWQNWPLACAHQWVSHSPVAGGLAVLSASAVPLGRGCVGGRQRVCVAPAQSAGGGGVRFGRKGHRRAPTGGNPPPPPISTLCWWGGRRWGARGVWGRAGARSRPPGTHQSRQGTSGTPLSRHIPVPPTPPRTSQPRLGRRRQRAAQAGGSGAACVEHTLPVTVAAAGTRVLVDGATVSPSSGGCMRAAGRCGPGCRWWSFVPISAAP